jgi:hypothetical protein
MNKIHGLILIISLLPTFCLATGTPTPEVIRDNSGLFQWILGIALLGNGLFMMRLLKSHDRLWARGDTQETRLSHLEGEHKAKTGSDC